MACKTKEISVTPLCRPVRAGVDVCTCCPDALIVAIRMVRRNISFGQSIVFVSNDTTILPLTYICKCVASVGYA